MSNDRCIGKRCLFYCFFPIFVVIYIVRAEIKAFRSDEQIFSKEQDASPTTKRRANAGIISGSLLTLMFFIASANF